MFSDLPQTIHQDYDEFLASLPRNTRSLFRVFSDGEPSVFTREGLPQIAMTGIAGKTYLGNPSNVHIFRSADGSIIKAYDNSDRSFYRVTSDEKLRPFLTTTSWEKSPFEMFMEEGEHVYDRLTDFVKVVNRLNDYGYKQNPPVTFGGEQVTKESLMADYKRFREDPLGKGFIRLRKVVGYGHSGDEQRQKCYHYLDGALDTLWDKPMNVEREMFRMCERVVSEPFDPRQEAGEYFGHLKGANIHIDCRALQDGLLDALRHPDETKLTPEARKAAVKLHQELRKLKDWGVVKTAFIDFMKHHSFQRLENKAYVATPPECRGNYKNYNTLEPVFSDKPYYHEEPYASRCTPSGFKDALREAYASVGIHSKDASGLLLGQNGNMKSVIFDSMSNLHPPANPSDEEPSITITRKPNAASFTVVDERSKESFLVIPEPWAKDAWTSEERKDIEPHILHDGKIWDYLYGHSAIPEDDFHPIEATAIDTFLSFAVRDEDGVADLQADWGKEPYADRIRRASCVASKFSSDLFQMDYSRCNDATELCNKMEDHFFDSMYCKQKETPRSRGIAELLRTKDYGRIHDTLLGYYTKELGRVKELEALGGPDYKTPKAAILR